jgi:hypothetical protein
MVMVGEDEVASHTFSRVDTRDKVCARTISCAPPSHANQPTFNLQHTVLRTTHLTTNMATEEQTEELEVLQSIYPDELQGAASRCSCNYPWTNPAQSSPPPASA